MRRIVAFAALVAGVLVLWAQQASAHPLGNFTVNVYTGLRVQPERLVIDLVVDMAEIPTFQARRGIDRDGDGRLSDAESQGYAAGACTDAAAGLNVAVDGRSVPVRREAADVRFPPGTGGLDTLRLTCALVAEIGELAAEQQLVVRNRNYEDRVGWREMAAVGDRVTMLASDVARSSISDRLARYPDDLLQSPPDQRMATLRARPGGPAAPPGFGPASLSAPASTRGVDGITRSFTELVGRQRLTPGFGLLAMILSIVLGAVHAVAPGHGKTMMAAYLVGRRGSLRQAAVLGVTVTLTHTAGVLALGVALSASSALAPEALYPWLGLASGVLLAGIGAALLRGAVRRATHSHLPTELTAVGASRHHDHSHIHPHGEHGHEHAVDDGAMGRRSLVAIGFAGGLVPSPSALVVLLGAIALGRAWLGVVLVIGYGLGMAATLAGARLVLVRFRDALDRRTLDRDPGRFALLARVVPVVTSALILGVGALLSFRALAQM